MGQKYKQLDQIMRDRIKAQLQDGRSYRKIGKTLGLDHTTVAREVARNRYGNDGRTPLDKRLEYDPATADDKAATRRKYAKYTGKRIEGNSEILAFIKLKLPEHWGPDGIAGHMKLHKPCAQLPEGHCHEVDCTHGLYASKTAIYSWLYSSRGQEFCVHLRSKRYKPKKHGEKTERPMIPDRTSIDERPAEVATRERPGDWEGDTVVSGKKTGSKVALAVFQERMSRLVRAIRIENLKTESFNEAAILALTSLLVITATFDNGIENRGHVMIATALNILIFFCDPS
jgi:IS30 family transposase